jgi:hypothetical protein
MVGVGTRLRVRKKKLGKRAGWVEGIRGLETLLERSEVPRGMMITRKGKVPLERKETITPNTSERICW